MRNCWSWELIRERIGIRSGCGGGGGLSSRGRAPVLVREWARRADVLRAASCL